MELKDLLKKYDDCTIVKLFDIDGDNYYKGTSSVALDSLPAEILEDEVIFEVKEEQNIVKIYTC